MVKIPFTKIPSVRVGSIGPTSNIGTGGATPAPPTPIIYLTQWRMMGNSTVHTDPYLTQWKVEGNSVVSNPSANLPQGYKKCKYLESHGTEYIELPFGFDKTDEVYAKAALVDLTRVYDMFFVAPKTWNDNNNRYGLGCHNHFGVAYGSKSTSTTTFSPLKEPDIDVHTYSYANELFTFDGGVGLRDVFDVAFGSTTDNLRLFHTYNSDVKWRIYAYHHVKINSNNLGYDTEINLVPCLDDNNVPCLYDTISGTTYYNDGTGTFGYELEQPTILSCGDLGQDGKYHVKISNGVNVYDIPLTEPLRKVNNVADTIELADGMATVTRYFASGDMGNYSWSADSTSESGIYRMRSSSIQSVIAITSNVLCAIYDIVTANNTYNKIQGLSVSNNGIIDVYDENYNQSNSATAFKTAMAGVELIYELATPTTETIQVSPFPVSPTDTYTSANDTPYSAFEYKKNVEIWSCGEYSAVDSKYHILVQPLGGSIADIALDEPLRKVNDVADSIEFANGVTTVTRVFDTAILSNLNWAAQLNSSTNKYRYFTSSLNDYIKYIDNATIANLLCAIYKAVNANDAYATREQGIGIAVSSNGGLYLYDDNYNSEDDSTAFLAHINGVELIYELATPTTEVIQVPQIEEADSYTCVISQGGKAVSWSSFETNSE